MKRLKRGPSQFKGLMDAPEFDFTLMKVSKRLEDEGIMHKLKNTPDIKGWKTLMVVRQSFGAALRIFQEISLASTAAPAGAPARETIQ